MVSIQAARASTVAKIDKGAADSLAHQLSIGNLGMKRAKRDGRNPSTGARTSRRSWNYTFYMYNIFPLTGNGTGGIY